MKNNTKNKVLSALKNYVFDEDADYFNITLHEFELHHGYCDNIWSHNSADIVEERLAIFHFSKDEVALKLFRYNCYSDTQDSIFIKSYRVSSISEIHRATKSILAIVEKVKKEFNYSSDTTSQKSSIKFILERFKEPRRLAA